MQKLRQTFAELTTSAARPFLSEHRASETGRCILFPATELAGCRAMSPYLRLVCVMFCPLSWAVACSSTLPGDTKEEGCASWCNQKTHCRYCKCKRCSTCATRLRNALSAAPGATHPPLQRACPLPKLQVPAEDWRAYFGQLYGSSVSSSVEQVDVLNLTLLSNVSADGRAYASALEAVFPRGSIWGPCFGNACGRQHFAGNLNVHCNVELAWRLRMYRDSDDASEGHLPLRKGSWVEATHCGGSGKELLAAYFYAVKGSGLWVNVGRTIAFGVHEQAVRHFLRRNCSDRTHPNEGMVQCDGELDKMASAAAKRGFDSVQFVRHCDAKCEQCLHELVMLHVDGRPGCPQLSYRRGDRAQLPCTCVERSNSVGTIGRPFRGRCATCS